MFGSNIVLIIYLVMSIIMIGFTFVVIIDKKLINNYRVAVLVNVAFVFLLLIQNFLDYRFSLTKEMYFARRITGIIGYSVRPAIIVMWMYFVRKNQKLIISWTLVIINFLVHSTALFSEVCFSITTENTFKRGPLGFTCHVVSAILLLYLLWLSADRYIDSANQRDDGNEREMWKRNINSYRSAITGLVPVGCVFLIFASVFMDSTEYIFDGAISFLTMAIVVSNTLYFLWLHKAIAKELVDHKIYGELSMLENMETSNPQNEKHE